MWSHSSSFPLLLCALVQLSPAAAYVLAYEVLFGQVGSSVLEVLVLQDVDKQLAMHLWQSPALLCFAVLCYQSLHRAGRCVDDLFVHECTAGFQAQGSCREGCPAAQGTQGAHITLCLLHPPQQQVMLAPSKQAVVCSVYWQQTLLTVCVLAAHGCMQEDLKAGLQRLLQEAGVQVGSSRLWLHLSAWSNTACTAATRPYKLWVLGCVLTHVAVASMRLQDAAAWLQASQQQGQQQLQPAAQHPRHARVNLLKSTVQQVLAQLQDSSSGSFGVHVDDLLPDLLVFPPRTDLHDHPLVTQGVLILQVRQAVGLNALVRTRQKCSMLQPALVHAAVGPNQRSTHAQQLPLPAGSHPCLCRARRAACQHMPCSQALAGIWWTAVQHPATKPPTQQRCCKPTQPPPSPLQRQQQAL